MKGIGIGYHLVRMYLMDTRITKHGDEVAVLSKYDIDQIKKLEYTRVSDKYFKERVRRHLESLTININQ